MSKTQVEVRMTIHSEARRSHPADICPPIALHSLLCILLATVVGSVIAGCASVPAPPTIDESRLNSERHHLTEIALASWEDEQRRVYVVSHRLLQAADDLQLCHSPHATRGVLLEDLASLPPGLAVEVQHDEALLAGLPVIALDSQASAASQLQIGDVVTVINGLPTPSSIPSDWDSDRPIDVVVSRNGELLNIHLQTHPLCNIPIALDESHDTGASESFSDVRIQQGMVQALSDDDSLALVLGHEFGHIMNGDSLMVRIFDRAGSREQERRADAFGLKLLTAAGYDPRRVRDVWERLAKIDPDRVGQNWLKDHPLRAERSLRMKDAVSTGDSNSVGVSKASQ